MHLPLKSKAHHPHSLIVPAQQSQMRLVATYEKQLH